MMGCCDDKSCEVASLQQAGHRRILAIVLALNAAMFVIEAIAGGWAHSTALMADALDMLGDALVYGLSLYAVGRSARWQASAALTKGVVMLVFGGAVLAEAIHKIAVPVLPDAAVMGATALLALAVNAGCFALLYKIRADNLNMRSTWICSRNDVVANVFVMGAALASALVTSRWPDILVGAAIALLFLRSAWSVIMDASAELNAGSSVA